MRLCFAYMKLFEVRMRDFLSKPRLFMCLKVLVYKYIYAIDPFFFIDREEKSLLFIFRCTKNNSRRVRDPNYQRTLALPFKS